MPAIASVSTVAWAKKSFRSSSRVAGTDQPDGERLRELLAQATEIDLVDVHIEVGPKTVELWGTVADDGERLQLEELVAG